MIIATLVLLSTLIACTPEDLAVARPPETSAAEIPPEVAPPAAPVLPTAPVSPAATTVSAFKYRTNPNVKHSINLHHVLQGVSRPDPRDAIPPIYKPNYVSADKAEYMNDSEKVIGLVVEGVARAYPTKVLDRHEIVNDTVGSSAFAVTYCPLCGSGVVYDRNVAGKTLTFGVSGFLYQSDLLMWDHESESFWSQIEGAAVVGPMTGTKLNAQVANMTTWKQWRTEHPKTELLVGPYGANGYNRYPYGNYESTDRLIFPVLNEDKRFHRKRIVTGIQINGVAKAYPHQELKKAGGSLTDTVGGQTVTIKYNATSHSCRIFDKDGTELPVLRAFWFAWHTFHPNTDVYQTKSD